MSFKAETAAPFDEDGDLIVSDLEYARLAAWHAADWVREPGRAAIAIAQIREARAALDRAERLLSRYTAPDCG